MKHFVFIVALFISGTCHANGNLHTLIVELENVKRLVVQQQKKASDEGGRWVFRYDVLQQRLDQLIADINRHIDVVNQSPRLERFE